MADELIHTFEGYGTGALPRKKEWRDLMMHCEPGISAQMEVGSPASDDHLIAFIKGCYNQGAVPSCVPNSSAGMQSINEQIERAVWIEMDAERCYRDNGGNGSNGVDTQRVLSYMQTQGMPVVGSALRYKLSTYAFANPMQPQGVEALKAAISTGHPCVLALLLPMDFMSGMAAGVSAVNTAAYHQVCIVAYTPERVIFLNSWGSSYGNNGLGSVPWEYLQRPQQQGYVYAYTEVDSPDTDVTPVPVPVPPVPIPPPVPLGITGYLNSVGNVPLFSGGALLQVVGSGFDVGVIQAAFNGTPLAIEDKSAPLLKVRLPKVTEPQIGRVTVQREAETRIGPLLVVTPNGGPTPVPVPVPVPVPPPPGGLKLIADVRPSVGLPGLYRINVTASDGAGNWVAANWTASIDGVPLNTFSNTSTAAWQARGTPSMALVIHATAADGRSGSLGRTLGGN